MRSALALLVATCTSACGAPPRAPVDTAATTVELRPRLAAGSRYLILHRERWLVDGEPAGQHEMRVYADVVEVRPDGGARLSVRLLREQAPEAGESLVDAVVTVELGPDGRVVGDPERRCGELHDLRIGRYLRHLFGLRSFVARGVGEGSEWRGQYLADVSEIPAPARFRVQRVEEGAVYGRMIASHRVHDGEVGDLRFTGRGRSRGRFRVDLGDGFAGETSVELRLAGDAWSPQGGERPARVRLQTRVVARRASRPAEGAMTCGFDPSLVTARIRGELVAIQACYEDALTQDPTLAGRVLVRFTIERDGSVSDLSVPEDSLNAPAVNACVMAHLRQLRFTPGPIGGSVTFAYPFVFAPQS